MNTIHNACFEFGTLEGWQKTNSSNANLVRGNGWGNHVVGTGKNHATGTSKFELRLGPGTDGISQVIERLAANTAYRLSAWARVSDEGETVVVGVKQHGGKETRTSTSSTEWTRLSLDFSTGRDNTQATIYVLKSTDRDGHAWCDNLTLPLQPSSPTTD